MEYKNHLFPVTIIISVCLHGIFLFLIPLHQLYTPHLQLVEVSLVAFPSHEFSIPEYLKGESSVWDEYFARAEHGGRYWRPGTGEPLAREGHKDILSMRDDISPGPAIGERLLVKRPSAILTKKGVKEHPGLPDRSGVFHEEGRKDEYQITGPVSARGIVRAVHPRYPEWAEKGGIQGEVQLRFWVLPEGVVNRVEVVTTSGYADLDQIAVAAMRQWLFEPVSQQEGMQEQWGMMTLRFQLK